MQNSPAPQIRLTLPLEPGLVRVVTGLAENSALALGLGAPQAMALTLAVEEVFAYLTQASQGPGSVELACRGGGYYVAIDLVANMERVDLRALNLTFQVRLEDEDSLAQMGLLIAARSLDRLDLAREANNVLRFSLVKEKAYPSSHEGHAPTPRALTNHTIRKPQPAELKWVSRLITQVYPSHLVPPELTKPARLVDMVAAGDMRALVAADQTGNLGGAITWNSQGERTVLCQGPYLLGQPEGSSMAADLIEAMLQELARTPAVILLNMLPTPELPPGYFEPLGNYVLYPPQGVPREVTVQFRALAEDPGATVWAHPSLEEFLEKQYQRLFMPRQVLAASAEGENLPAHSVLATQWEPSQGQAALRPLQGGRDAAENLSDHVKLMRDQMLPTLFFEMDLGQAWQADFVPGLTELGFKPRLVVPHGAKGDLLLWQLGSLL